MQNKVPTAYEVTGRQFDEEADNDERDLFELFRNGYIPEEELREALEFYRAGRTRPSKFRVIDIVEARSKFERLLSKAIGGAVACSATSKPPMPARRKAKKKKR